MWSGLQITGWVKEYHRMSKNKQTKKVMIVTLIAYKGKILVKSSKQDDV